MSVIVFYPKSVNKDSYPLFRKNKFEPLPDCVAKEMVLAYEYRMNTLEKHIANHVYAPPAIDFLSEKIGYELGKEFFDPFYDGTVTGCEGFIALNCMDVDSVGKHYTSVILFGVDAHGYPLPDAEGYIFFEKWPGRLLKETAWVVREFFPGCRTEDIFDKPGSENDPEPEPDRFPIPYAVARGFALSYVNKWDTVNLHLQTSILPPPEIPAANVQPLVLNINKAEMGAILKDMTKLSKIACILCTNPNTAGTTDDDTLSLIFVGLDARNRPISIQAFEKWPDLYKVSDLVTATGTILNPQGTTLDPQQFNDAVTLANDFSTIWNALINDATSTPPTPRPHISRDNHPLVFFIDKYEMKAIVDNTTCELIAGVFGYNSAAGYDFAAPMFVGVGKGQKPVSNIIFAQKSVAYTVRNWDIALQTVLTEAP